MRHGRFLYMAVEHRIIAVTRLSPEERATLLEELGKEGWSPVLLYEGAASWSRSFPTGFVVLEREVPAQEEPRWCAW